MSRYVETSPASSVTDVASPYTPTASIRVQLLLQYCEHPDLAPEGHILDQAITSFELSSDMAPETINQAIAAQAELYWNVDQVPGVREFYTMATGHEYIDGVMVPCNIVIDREDWSSVLELLHIGVLHEFHFHSGWHVQENAQCAGCIEAGRRVLSCPNRSYTG